MKKLAAFSLLFSLSPALAQQLTYWIDQSCTNHNANFEDVVEDSLTMASRANQRLHSNTDNDFADLFKRIWKQDKTDQGTFNTVDRILGLPAVPPNTRYGIAGMIKEPNNDRRAANIRYYCDDDPQNVNGGSRWTLRPDPNPAPPGYTPQAQRPRASNAQPGQQYQEWQDVDNGILMGNTGGCKDALTQAETFFIMRPGAPPAGNANIRATVTICDIQMNRNLHRFADVPLKKDITQLVNPPQGRTGVQAFEVMTSMVLLHEACHLPGFDLDDQPSPNPRGNHDTAYGWADVQDLASTADSLNNADNFAYFGVLAKLADRHFRLSKNSNEAKDGKLVYDRNGISSKVKEKREERIGGGRLRRWWMA